MVLIDDDYIKENRKVTAHLLAAFRYGREDLDVLGLIFRKDLISQSFQVSVSFFFFFYINLFQEKKKNKMRCVKVCRISCKLLK